MLRKLVALAFFLVLFLLSLTAYGQPSCGVHCGTERWKVKTLTDTTVGNIDPTVVPKTINWLRTRSRPSQLPNTRRLIGIETMTFKVVGVVLTFKKEDDKDIHVVLAQPNNHARTMIIEFKDGQCANVCSSVSRQRMTQARADFVSKFGEPTTTFKNQENPVRVEIIGIGFFDRMHGQRGRGLPSGVEIHPVLSFRVLE